MKQTPILIELKPSGSHVATWELHNDFWARGDRWVQERKRWTYPTIALVLGIAFSASMSPWVKNYQTAKEINQIASDMHSFKVLYGSYGDQMAPQKPANFAEPLDGLVDSIVAKMTIVGISEQKIDVVKSTYTDKNYYLVGRGKEILVKPMTYDSCTRMMGDRRVIQSSLQKAVLDSLTPEHRKEISCYMQTWKSEPPKEFLEHTVKINGVNATPMAVLIIKPGKSKSHNKSARPKLMSI